MEGSLVAYKVFTNGSVLNASEINDNLMNQSVMVFSNSTARDAALTSPLEGMITYLEDTSSYKSYNGTTWVDLVVPPESGLTLIGSTSVTAATNILLDNVFSSTYDNYQIVYSLTHSAAISSTFRYVNTDGTDNSNSNYSNVVFGVAGAAPSVGIVYNNNNVTSANSMIYDGDQSAGIMVFYSPNAARNTLHSGQGMSGSRVSNSTGGRFNGSTQFRGIRFTIASGNVTGTFKVYGMRN
jgi:hypothetical protein